jgi:hypothetical protein
MIFAVRSFSLKISVCQIEFESCVGMSELVYLPMYSLVRLDRQICRLLFSHFKVADLDRIR